MRPWEISASAVVCDRCFGWITAISVALEASSHSCSSSTHLHHHWPFSPHPPLFLAFYIFLSLSLSSSSHFRVMSSRKNKPLPKFEVGEHLPQRQVGLSCV